MSYIGKTPTSVPLTSSDITDGIITTTKIADDAATADKIANAVNSAITANTAKTGITSSQTSAITANTSKTTNATHTGEVTGATALTIADNAVTLAKMASGTDGNIISYDTSGNPVAVATGSSGQVLTSAGAGAVPTFADAAGGANTPSFLAYKSESNGSQNNSNNADTKITFPTEDYDIGSCYNTSTSKFTPGVAGKYLITTNISVNLYSNLTYIVRASIFKNGAALATNGLYVSAAVANSRLNNNNRFNLTIIDTANTSDYYEVYFYANGNNANNVYIEESSTPAGLLATSFSGFKIIT